MADETFSDEIDLFDNIDDLINFPSVTDNCYDLADIWTNNSDELQASNPIFSDTNCVSDLSPDLAVPVSI